MSRYMKCHFVKFSIKIKMIFISYYVSWSSTLLSIEWNLIKLCGPAHEIMTKTVNNTLPRGVRDMVSLACKDPGM